MQPRRRKVQVGAAGLIEIGETLLGRHGPDGISMRQIAAAAGLSNPASVQYHFGSRDDLIRAIWQSRLPDIDIARAHLLNRLPVAEQSDPGKLLDCLLRPLAYEFRTFAEFLSHMLRSREHLQLRLEFDHLTPVSHVIAVRLAEQLGLEKDVFEFRLLTTLLLVLDALASPSPTVVLAWQQADPTRAYNEALAAALGCLTAPPAVF